MLKYDCFAMNCHCFALKYDCFGLEL